MKTVLNINKDNDNDLQWRSIWVGAVGLLTLVPMSYIFRYRRSIRRRLLQIEDRWSTVGIMVRDTVVEKNPQSGRLSFFGNKEPRRELKCLELNDEFVNNCAEEWKLMSLGQYLTSLRLSLPGDGDDEDPGQKLPEFIERELEATIGAVLLKALGRRFGGAVLPLLGITDVQSRTAKIAGSIASWWISHYVLRDQLEQMKGENNPLYDIGTLPMNLSEIVAMANLNEKFVSSNMEIKSMEWMRRGEVGYEPSFDNSSPEDEEDDEETSPKKLLIPNPFIVSEHWDKAIEGMEALIRSHTAVKGRDAPNAEARLESNQVDYNPEDRSFPEPTPVNKRLLPDLYMGWGNAKCTHTKREIVGNRLVSVLFNKLSYNFYKIEQKQSDLFVVKMDASSDKPIMYPQDFLQALLDAGHTVEMCPKSLITSFGLALCVKDKDEVDAGQEQSTDGSDKDTTKSKTGWTNIPVGLFIRSGYENKEDRSAHYVMPHGGMSLHIEGPLIGKDSSGKHRNCDIQFYMAVEGMCGWHSNHNADVPWLQAVSTTETYTIPQTVLAMKLAGVLAVTFNAIGTEYDLPYGGYGILGVCNDTAALVDFGVRGSTNMFPLVSTGRFMIRSSRRLIQLYENIKDEQYIKGDKSFGEEIGQLIAACCKIPSDLQASPVHLINSSERFLASQPEHLCFLLEKESKTIMTNLKAKFDDFDESIRKLSRVSSATR